MEAKYMSMLLKSMILTVLFFQWPILVFTTDIFARAGTFRVTQGWITRLSHLMKCTEDFLGINEMHSILCDRHFVEQSV